MSLRLLFFSEPLGSFDTKIQLKSNWNMEMKIYTNGPHDQDGGHAHIVVKKFSRTNQPMALKLRCSTDYSSTLKSIKMISLGLP